MRKKQRGQGMTEYILLVALIAIAAIAAVRYFGSKTKEGFENAADAVGGVSEGMKKDSSGGSTAGAVIDEVRKKGGI